MAGVHVKLNTFYDVSSYYINQLNLVNLMEIVCFILVHKIMYIFRAALYFPGNHTTIRKVGPKAAGEVHGNG